MKKLLMFCAMALLSVSAHAFYFPILAEVEFTADDGRLGFFNFFTLSGEVVLSRDYPAGALVDTEVRVQCGYADEPNSFCADMKFYAEFQQFFPPFYAVLCIGPREELNTDNLWMPAAYAAPPTDMMWVRSCWTT